MRWYESKGIGMGWGWVMGTGENKGMYLPGRHPRTVRLKPGTSCDLVTRVDRQFRRVR